MNSVGVAQPEDPAGREAEFFRSRGFRLRVSAAFLEQAERQGWTRPEGFAALDTCGRSAPGGRGPHRLIDAAIVGETLRVRPARHGGVLSRLLGDRFIGPGRVLREFRLWERLAARSVPLATLVFAGSLRRGVFWHARLATLERVRALDGLRWLGTTHPDAPTRARAGVSVAVALRKLHDAGAIHGDLQLRNLLLEPDEPEHGQRGRLACRLIDLDRARFVDPVSPALRMREWMRLARSLEKRGGGEMLTPRLRACILSAYCAGDRTLRREMLRAAPLESRRTARHRLAWKLTRGTATERN